jgi:uncharacterized protein YkwD
VLLGAWGGWRRGFVVSVLGLLVLAASLVAAFAGYRIAADWIADLWPRSGEWAAPAGFVGTFVLVHLLLSLIASRLARLMPARVHAHGVNRFLGLAPGTANGAINAGVIAMLLITLPLADALSRAARDSVLVERLTEPAEWLEAQLSPIFDPVVRGTLQAITVPPESRASIKLPFRVDHATVRADLESRMLQMVNEERIKKGLKPLAPDPELTEVARAHSRDMLARGYFAHATPEGGTLADRMRKARLRYIAAGENLAFAQTLPIAHDGLMDSPGHRANILQPRFRRAGIGVLDAGKYGLMVTQNFRN